MELSGKSIIGSQAGGASGQLLYATNPATGARLEPDFHAATAEEVDKAVNLADHAARAYSRVSGPDKALFLRKSAPNIEADATPMADKAEMETALPKTRLQGETARPCGLLRLFAQVVEEGSWVI